MNEVERNKLEQLRKEDVKRVKLAFTDIDGVHRGKYIGLDKFASVLEKGGGWCDCVLGWDINDQLYDKASFTGWHTAFPDARYVVDLSTERRLADEDDIPFYLVNLADESGGLHDICPRCLLRRVLEKAEAMKLGVHMAFEYEFLILDETPNSIREKGFRNLKSLTPGNFGYSLLRTNTHSDLFGEFMGYCEKMKFPLEGLHCETGPGA